MVQQVLEELGCLLVCGVHEGGGPGGEGGSRRVGGGEVGEDITGQEVRESGDGAVCKKGANGLGVQESGPEPSHCCLEVLSLLHQE